MGPKRQRKPTFPQSRRLRRFTHFAKRVTINRTATMGRAWQYWKPRAGSDGVGGLSLVRRAHSVPLQHGREEAISPMAGGRQRQVAGLRRTR